MSTFARMARDVTVRILLAMLCFTAFLTRVGAQDGKGRAGGGLEEGPWALERGPVIVGIGLVFCCVALLLAGLVVERRRRRRAEESAAARLRFETLLSEESAVFSGLAATDVDRDIERALRRIVDFLGADRGSLVAFSQDRPTLQVTHSWVAQGVAAPPSVLAHGALPWAVARLQAGEVVRFSQVEELPAEEAAMDRATYRRLGVGSQVLIPLVARGTVLGALAFSTVGRRRVWPDDLIPRLRILGEVFAGVLSRRRLELEAHRLRQELGHVGRVATLGALTTSLTHELNQPLTAILSNAQAAQRFLASDAVDLAEVREILRDIVEDDRRAVEVISRLRGLLKKSDLKPVVLDLNETVEEVARLVTGDAAIRHLSIRLELAPGLPPVRGDRVQLQQVILNLVLNGLDAMQDAAAGRRTLVLRTARDAAAAVRVAVQDSGMGIDQADLDRLFEAFYTTKADGMGMGLAIARSIVEAHGGQLEAASHPNGGATFSFTLPVSGEGP